MVKKMTERELIWRAFYDAAAWQDSLADSYQRGADRDNAMARAKAYRDLMVKRYGTYKTEFDREIDDAKSVSIWDLPVSGS